MTIAEPIRFLPQDFGIGHKLGCRSCTYVISNLGSQGLHFGGAAYWGGLYMLKSKQRICLQREETRADVSQEKETKKKVEERETEIIPFGYLQI